MWAVIGILAALQRRNATGLGCEVGTSLFETALSWIGAASAGYQATGRIPPRRGSENPSLVPYKVFQASDGDLVIAAGNDNLFRKLAHALGRPDWLDDARFATAAPSLSTPPPLLLLSVSSTSSGPRPSSPRRSRGAPGPARRCIGAEIARTTQNRSARDDSTAEARRVARCSLLGSRAFRNELQCDLGSGADRNTVSFLALAPSLRSPKRALLQPPHGVRVFARARARACVRVRELHARVSVQLAGERSPYPGRRRCRYRRPRRHRPARFC